MNYSLVDSISCGGSETSLSQCTVNTGASCLAWCPDSNIGLKCFGMKLKLLDNNQNGWNCIIIIMQLLLSAMMGMQES